MSKPSDDLLQIVKDIEAGKAVDTVARLRKIIRVVKFVEDSVRRHCQELEASGQEKAKPKKKRP